MMKKILLLTIVFSLGLASCNKGDTPVPPKEDDATFSGGSGTKADPFRIAKPADLVSLANLSNGEGYSKVSAAWFVQTADIDLSGSSGFSTICNSPDRPFTGNYDGGNHKISGLGKGMFGFGDECIIRSVTIDANINQSGENVGAVIDNIISGEYSNLTVNGLVSGQAKVGGIVGSVHATSSVLISDCKCFADIEGTRSCVGGLIGMITAESRVRVNRCTCYGNIRGQYAVGGITGCSCVPDSSKTGTNIAHTNCVYSGLNIELSGNDQSKGYGMLGGIVGWMNTIPNNGLGQFILNCASYVYKMSYVSRSGDFFTTDPCAGGIVGFQDGNVGSSCIAGCYSSFQVNRLWCDGQTKARTINNNFPEGLNYGGIFGRSSIAMPYHNCYYDNTIKMGPSISTMTNLVACGDCGPYVELVKKLNSFVSSYSGEFTLDQWAMDDRGCVVPSGTTTVGGRRIVRISIIGDSISTYRSWIPIGFDVYYYDNKTVSGISTPCDVTWDTTYWGRLARDYFNGGVIEKNIAWSGSCVASCDDQDAKPGFVTRLIRFGVGAPDVVFIHGGTNDFNNNYNGTKIIDNTEGYAYNVNVPNSVMQVLFAKDTASLNTAYYADSNLKMVKHIHNLHPKAKIVFVMGDRVGVSMVDAVKQIANHYSDFCRLIDLKNVSVQKFSGSHPTAKGHGAIAEEIYSKTGSWIEAGLN